MNKKERKILMMKYALYGFAIGDAIGVPYEFRKRHSFRCNGMEKAKFPSQRFFLPAGTWSDDTATALCLLDAIRYLPDKKKSQRKLISNMRKWLFLGKYSATYTPPFDIGVSTFKGILSKTILLPYNSAGERNNGNGGLMRCFPIAFIDTKTDEEILDYIKLYIGFTHGHDVSNTACLIYIKILKNVMVGETLYNAIKNSCINNFFDINFLSNCSEDEIKSTGYVVDTLNSVLYCLLQTDNFKDAVLKAVNLGHDTDTIAALVGCVAGLYYKTIPDNWNIARQKLLENFCK